MDVSAWIALAGLGAGLVAQVVVMAFMFGQLFNRVKQMEGKPDTDCKAELATLNTKFGFLETTLNEMAKDVKGLLTGTTPLRRRAGGE